MASRISFLVAAIAALAVFNIALAECPNGCSGHGSCAQYDQCTCCRNWYGGDCSLRVCPYGTAFVDNPKGDLNGDNAVSLPTVTVITDSQVFPYGTWEKYPPAGDNEGHYYAECSNKGLCDRTSGTCQCFTGYEGSACQRSPCPNDCNGHGTCEYIKEIVEDMQDVDVVSNLDLSGIVGYDYELWDKVSQMGCNCDSGYFGPDCSERKCTTGVDPLYSGTPVYEKTTVDVVLGSAQVKGTIDMKFYDYTGNEYRIERVQVGDYDDQTLSGTMNYTDITTCSEIMEYFPPYTLQDTVSGTTTYPFCTLLSGGSGVAGMKYTFDYNADNAGWHKDIVVDNVRTNITGGITVTVTNVMQGVNVEYTDDGSSYDLILPGYVVAVENDTITHSTDITQFIDPAPTSTQTDMVLVDGTMFKIEAVNNVLYEMTTDVNVYRSVLTVKNHGQITGRFGIYGDNSTQPVMTARLTEGYTYVSECSNRGTCNRDSAVCECYNGYTLASCDTQTPTC